jgi:hypothetical protein
MYCFFFIYVRIDKWISRDDYECKADNIEVWVSNYFKDF